MDKQQRYNLYKYSVAPDWWRILDKYVPKILELDPDCDLSIKEKYALLRIDVYSDKINAKISSLLEGAAEAESSEICEKCGQVGDRRNVRGWYKTLCDRCFAARDDLALVRKFQEETEEKWLEEAVE